MPLSRTSVRKKSRVVKPVGDARKPTKKNEQLIAKVPQRVAEPLTGRTIIALDPGGSTGVAVRLPDGSWVTDTITDPADLWDLFRAPVGPPDICVFEIFTTGGRVDKWMIYTIELVGGIRAVCYVQGVMTFHHSPGKRYPWLQQAERMLKGQGHTRHEVDALAHLLAYEGRAPDGRT